MYYLNARLEGEVVAGVIIHTTEDMLGVYGISTLMRYRRRGYASALMRAALALRPDLPMMSSPTRIRCRSTAWWALNGRARLRSGKVARQVS